MKFFSSSSSSSASSTITTSFDPNSNSKNATSSCIAGVFRRLLCLNTLPTYPSDHDHDHNSVEFDKFQCIKTEEKIEGSGTPNLVARLMGLDSFPQKDSNLILRSRSMNSVDSMKELRLIEDKHRRVKSFRENPTFLELEDENFLILSFENDPERMKLAVKGRKTEVGSGQVIKNKKTETLYGKNKTNYQVEMAITESKKSNEMAKDSSNILRTKNNCYQNSESGSGITTFGKARIDKPESEKCRRKMKKRKDECSLVKKIETESDSENSSPNSVLDHIDFSCDSESTSSGEVTRLKNSKTRRTLTEELENYRKLNLQNGKNLSRSSCKSKSEEGKCVQIRKKYSSSHQRNIQLWGEICRIAEKDTIESSWLQKKIHNNWEDSVEIISKELELRILDQLVNELVDDLLHGNFHEFF